MPSVSALTHFPWPLMNKYAGEWAFSMPMRPEAKAPSGSTHRPVQEIGLIVPSFVACASRSVSAIIASVSKVGA